MLTSSRDAVGSAHYLNKVKGATISHPTLDRNIVVIMDDHDSSHVRT